jgi:N-acetylmuramoyl-L-alanine amidase
MSWLGLAVLAACAPWPRGAGTLPVDTRYTAIGQDSRVLFIILHYTAEDFDGSLKVLTQGEVSSHYLIDDAPRPTVYRLVDESRRAWHAGPSYWKGHAMLNASSVGIEIVNRGYTDTPQGRVWHPYSDAQIDAVIALVKDIAARHRVRPERILGHSDVLPQDKQDPGPMFPWKRLAEAGLVPWPDAARVAAQRAAYASNLPEVAWFQQALARHGFEVPQTGQLDDATRNVIAAFQMKYRPAKFDGQPDAETAALLHVLTTPA